MAVREGKGDRGEGQGTVLVPAAMDNKDVTTCWTYDTFAMRRRLMIGRGSHWRMTKTPRTERGIEVDVMIDDVACGFVSR